VKLFHITTREAWDAAKRTGEYRAPSLETEGFIHLSTGEQWPRTARRFFLGQSGLVLLCLEDSLLDAPVRFEPVHGEAFPHLYGPLATRAVLEVTDLPVFTH